MGGGVGGSVSGGGVNGGVSAGLGSVVRSLSTRAAPLVENATLLYDFCGDFRENRIDLSVYSPNNNVLLDY